VERGKSGEGGGKKVRKRKKYGRALMLVLLAGLAGAGIFPMASRASVTAVPEAAGGPDCVYVAGNPDWYPVEYYDKETKSYQGMIPEILKEVSAKTGLSFTYIRAGEEDQRFRLAKNSQVELVSGLTGEEAALEEDAFIESRMVLSYTRDGREEKACLAFTKIADEALVSEIEEALSGISGSRIQGIALELMTEQRQKAYPSWLWAAAFGVLFLCVLVIVILSVRLFRYRQASMRDSYFDPAVGLGNKEYFIKYFQEYISDQYRAGCCVAYLAFDIEHVNRYYGEQEAEAQLQYAANELLKSTADNDIAARVSGGGFALVHPCTGEEEAGKWVEELLTRLNRYTEKYGLDYHPDFSAGIYMMKQSDRDGETVLFNARQGYRQALKTNTAYAFSRSGMIKEEREKMQLRKKTHEAVENREFKLFLQFVIEAGSGRITGAECLSRWEHPQKGILRPEYYIELMEEEGTIRELDLFMFREACRQMEAWEREGKELSLSCNFTRMTIAHEDFIKDLTEIAGKYDFHPSNMVLEITEDAMELNKNTAFENVSKCKEMGFRIALDDAGSGYTSFADLRDYPIDIVKIDRSILTFAVNKKGIALLKGMIILAHNLGMKVLCEGVETSQQLALLKELQCDYMQGYYFYRALPGEEAGRILNEAQ